MDSLHNLVSLYNTNPKENRPLFIKEIMNHHNIIPPSLINTPVDYMMMYIIITISSVVTTLTLIVIFKLFDKKNKKHDDLEDPLIYDTINE